jgi:hypothetical protein
VLGIVPVTGSGGYAVSTSAPSNAIHVVDGETLRVVGSLSGGGGGGSGFSKGKGAAGGGAVKVAHEGGVTCLKSAVGAGTTGGLISCGKEGSVVIWDTRSSGGSGKVGVKSTFLLPTMAGLKSLHFVPLFSFHFDENSVLQFKRKITRLAQLRHLRRRVDRSSWF